MLAAIKSHRNSIGVEIDPHYCKMILHRLQKETEDLFNETEIKLVEANDISRSSAETAHNTAQTAIA
jgi:site-specific DNA-methyltransferase (adenine-specific)